MIHFGHISRQKFLQEYWQKKPLLIKNAIPGFISPLSPDELAGLACEEEFESRIITGSTLNNKWTLERGPFQESTFKNLQDKEWTLLVQGVDRYIDEIHNLINEFDCIPRWRFDDIMMSFAALEGSVGPHFDHYDVFLLQGFGRRKWTVSSIDCNHENSLEKVPLRIMKNFIEEFSWTAEPGDVVYIPPKIAHHGESLDKECITVSIGYRSYSKNEMLDSLELPHSKTNDYFKDPLWTDNLQPAEIPTSAINQVKKFLKVSELPDEYFGCFVTKLDYEDEKKFNEISNEQNKEKLENFCLYRLHSICRIAYQFIHEELIIFINGEAINSSQIDRETLINFSNSRQLYVESNSRIMAERLIAVSLIYKV